MSIFISHPGLQHSHQLALALFEQGLLKEYWSGVPIMVNRDELPVWLPEKYASRIKTMDIPKKIRRHPYAFQLLIKAGTLLPAGFSKTDYTHRIFHAFDWWVAQHIKKIRPSIVIGFENSSYHTFKAAKEIGALCILDAPALQHLSAAKLTPTVPTAYLQEINRRKDDEVSMANLILTCSPLAAESYLLAGVKNEKIQSLLLGATVPPGIDKSWKPHNRPLEFIFAGALRKLKSIDLILNVFNRLHLEGFAYKITFVGGQGEDGWVQKIEDTPGALYHPSLPQNLLYKKLAEADCLLLPSRFDSFGMVVAEAMACGTPAIVSVQTGSKAIIEQFPKSGWIVDVNEDSLYSCIKERIINRDELFAARQNALEASRVFTWESYRKRASDLIKNWIA
ncbi:glycosyltransferase family 4 protein [Pseudomonas helleri]|uniref:glycosyltransferase family 4 protein n=1 Tax=Pseudomonas helleri TaxID=1608996 RepID=UPI000654AE19|nr:glycosyltransferase family 4 protein [Pseudomonas helleri]KMN22570.1 hypothetical protein TU85_13840 [Pseudomonas helleri]